MKESSLQFSNPRIEGVIFKIKEYIQDFEDDIPIDIQINVEKAEQECLALVRLNIIVGELNDEEKELKHSLYFNGVCSAKFRWKKDINNNIDDMLRINGGAVLLSYIRPILASLTMQAGMKPLHLPFINFKEVD